MSYQIFNIKLLEGEDALQELNCFLATHRILQVTSETLCYAGTPYKSFLVEYIEKEIDSAKLTNRSEKKYQKKDYKLLLPPRQYELLLKCKELRKQVSEDNQVNVFMVFKNDDLAAIVKSLPGTLAEMKRIPNVSRSCVDKYGKLFLDLLKHEVPQLKWGREELEWHPASQNTEAADVPPAESDGEEIIRDGVQDVQAEEAVNPLTEDK